MKIPNKTKFKKCRKNNIKNLSQNRLKTELKKIITINPKLKIEKNSLIKDFFSYIYPDLTAL